MSASSSSSSSSTFTLPPLPYGYDALEPAISAQIMETHHKKHHQTYVNNLNNAMKQYAEAESKNDLTKMVALQPAIRFNAGGHLNHSIFWTNMAPKSAGGGEPPSGELAKMIDRDFGGFEDLKKSLTTAALGVQGSGWAWLGYNSNAPGGGRLEVYQKPNQDPLTEAVPLLGIDVWEHAYYYLYGPARGDYLTNIFSVLSWKNAAERLQQAKGQGKL